MIVSEVLCLDKVLFVRSIFILKGRERVLESFHSTCPARDRERKIERQRRRDIFRVEARREVEGQGDNEAEKGREMGRLEGRYREGERERSKREREREADCETVIFSSRVASCGTGHLNHAKCQVLLCWHQHAMIR